MRYALSSLFLLSMNTTPSYAKDEIALISTNQLRYDYFDLATEAVEKGSKIIALPEWGFVSQQEDLNDELLQQWKQFAIANSVDLIMGARTSGKNTLLAISPKGVVQKYYRRDGNGSPIPSDENFLKPLTINTAYGKVGLMICDESRSDKFLTEMYTLNPDIDFIVSINNSGAFSDEEFLLDLAQRLGYKTDVYMVDTFGKFSWSGGSQTYAYIKTTEEILVNKFGNPSTIFGRENLKKSGEADYYISYFDRP